MSNVLKVALQETIRSLEKKGWSQRRIARELGVNRRTVGNYARALVVADSKCTTEVTAGSGEEATSKCTTLGREVTAGKSWEARSLCTYYILFFIHVGTRRVRVTGMTCQPNGPWVEQQARNFPMELEDRGEKASHLIAAVPRISTALI